ncbi:nuclear transport factor 2 (NTF2) domain-containing protein [Ditylenchus destructor]|uniref:Nuclear transport factor 2 (NTF2) domain-containing protein n=1 Tax=Ditylenchus destructor TaxID=166010 RepID=A0AAD4QSP5_9BILA|nr:nuclear transport factor 2 (NTF2) domain-containing protein [Ditylenchus destructor]
MDDLREEIKGFRDDVLNYLGEIEARLKDVERKLGGPNPNFEQIGNAFVQHYCSKYSEQDPALRANSLALLYDENSVLALDGNQVKGKLAILAKFGSLPFRTIQHAITKTDCQPLADGSIVVVVFGQVKTDEDPINSFSQCFVLKPNAAGSFFIANEIFRLVRHDI